MLKRLIKLAFIALAVGMAYEPSRLRIADSFTPIKDYVGQRIVPGRVEVMADQLDVRLGRGERLPLGWEGWLRRDYSGVPEDPWDNTYYLEVGRRNYTVGSMGPDGVQGTDDDFRITRSLEGVRR
jgi:hypothetical protein